MKRFSSHQRELFKLRNSTSWKICVVVFAHGCGLGTVPLTRSEHIPVQFTCRIFCQPVRLVGLSLSLDLMGSQAEDSCGSRGFPGSMDTGHGRRAGPAQGPLSPCPLGEASPQATVMVGFSEALSAEILEALALGSPSPPSFTPFNLGHCFLVSWQGGGSFSTVTGFYSFATVVINITITAFHGL
jgi:hypothetical protein